MQNGLFGLSLVYTRLSWCAHAWGTLLALGCGKRAVWVEKGRFYGGADREGVACWFSDFGVVVSWGAKRAEFCTKGRYQKIDVCTILVERLIEFTKVLGAKS